MDDILPLAIPQNMKTQSFAVTEVKTLKHTHTWVIKGFSQCECRYLETVPVVPTLDASKHAFRVRLHPQGNKESNKDFCFFQVFSQTSLKYRAKFCVANCKGEEIPATVYNGTQQLNGYFEYIRREQLIQHVQPQDEIKLSLQLTIVQDTVTRNTHVDPGITISPELTVRTMAKQLGDQFKDPQFTDFLIKCTDPSSKQEKEIKCHRFMLYSRSPYFRAMLQDHTLEFKKSEVNFEDIDFDIMQLFIEFLYSGNFNKVSKDHTVVQELLKLGDRFEVMELREAAEIALRQNLNVENVCEVLQIADLHNTKALKRECLRYICNNAVEVLRTDSWAQLSTHCPDLVTACMSHMVKSEESDDPPSKRFRSNDCS
uniref:BTB domain-containing protein n=1 Tax=Panagrolaimus superbus TaxID=310955 RepID=A0A914YEX6_9BILA